VAETFPQEEKITRITSATVSSSVNFYVIADFAKWIATWS